MRAFYLATRPPRLRRESNRASVLKHIRELLSAPFREVEDASDDDGKFAVGFKVTFDRGAQPTKLKVTCRIAKTISGEIEGIAEDARQQKLL